MAPRTATVREIAVIAMWELYAGLGSSWLVIALGGRPEIGGALEFITPISKRGILRPQGSKNASVNDLKISLPGGGHGTLTDSLSCGWLGIALSGGTNCP